MYKSKIINLSFFILFILIFFLYAQKISPYIVGNNVWLPEELTDEIWRITSECPVQILRIGGEGYDNSPYNQATLDGWIDKIYNLCKAEPIIQVPQNSSTEYAASLVQRYTKNKTTNKAIFYNIGNEPGLHGDNASIIANMIKRLSPAMRDVDFSIKIFVFDECDINYGNLATQLFDTPNGPNDITGKDSKGRWLVDGMSWHRYPGGVNASNIAYNGYNDIAERCRQAKEMMDRANSRQNRTGENALQWGIGEFNAPNGPLVHTFGCGQMVGGILGQCMKYGATYACLWDMFERGGNRTNSTDFSWIDGVGGKRPRAMYWHMAFVSREFSGNYADGSCNITDILTYGCKDENKNKLCAIIINRANTAQTYTLRFDKTTITTGNCRINIDANTNVQYQGNITGLTTQCLVFNLSGSLIRRYTYTSEDFNQLVPPKIENFNVPIIKVFPDKDNQNINVNSLKIYSGFIYLNFPDKKQYNLDIINLKGDRIFTQQGYSNKVTVNIQKISSGSYLLILKDKDNYIGLRKKFIIN
jgi:hypothetical protein